MPNTSVDYEKAFDNVKLTDVLKILRQRNVDSNILAIIKELNNDNACYIKANGNLSKSVQVADGIRQGDSLSLILFNVIIDKIINWVKKPRRGYRMGNREIKLIAYDDDIVLIFEDEDNLQRILYKF
ncbi:hypothetical protein M0802_015162 [Mischocyttarus mexicanus]|nr:hypothetical protein M0802_015162 [Mischocyttarus mexicanus]